MITRFIEETGMLAWLRVYQPLVEGETCPNGCHNAKIFLCESDTLGDFSIGGEPVDYPDERYPTHCEHCGTAFGSNAIKQVFRKRRYNTESGLPEPGDMFYIEYKEVLEPKRCMYWDNCEGRHLMVVLPNGHEWDTNGRASNCGRPDDRTHRCWVRHGDPEKGESVHIDKNGDTCQAGAGSISAAGWHGFLHNGELVEC